MAKFEVKETKRGYEEGRKEIGKMRKAKKRVRVCVCVFNSIALIDVD